MTTITRRARIRAAGDNDPAVWLADTIVPLVRSKAAEAGTDADPHRDLRLSMTGFLRDELDLAGSTVQVLQTLERMGVLTFSANGRGNRGGVWRVNMTTTYTAKHARAALIAVTLDRRASRQARRAEQAPAATPEPEPAPAPFNGQRATVTTELAGGHQAIVLTPETDQRYRELLDIIADLRATLSRRDAELERERDKRAEAEAEVTRLREAADPSVAEADAVIAAYRKGEL